jgi:hypothetical protein
VRRFRQEAGRLQTQLMSSIYFRSGNDIPNLNWILDNYKTTGVVNRITNSAAFSDITDRLKMSYRVGLTPGLKRQEFMLNKGSTALVNGFTVTACANTIWDHNLNILYSQPVNGDIRPFRVV